MAAYLIVGELTSARADYDLLKNLDAGMADKISEFMGMSDWNGSCGS
ncbi:hypothetical protein HYR69_08345 [Candidatus Sumerlaeota bacterium]|nr:hypothetical protein [Candidatus Sumerlaeota bacterium]MBI3737278.1 hypothetical protein [Candidatus Sumerlaeota bacterium]